MLEVGPSCGDTNTKATIACQDVRVTNLLCISRCLDSEFHHLCIPRWLDSEFHQRRMPEKKNEWTLFETCCWVLRWLCCGISKSHACYSRHQLCLFYGEEFVSLLLKELEDNRVYSAWYYYMYTHARMGWNMIEFGMFLWCPCFFIIIPWCPC